MRLWYPFANDVDIDPDEETELFDDWLDRQCEGCCKDAARGDVEEGVRTQVLIFQAADGHYGGMADGVPPLYTDSLDGMAEKIRAHIEQAGRDPVRVTFRATPQLKLEYGECYMCGGSGELPDDMASSAQFLEGVEGKIEFTGGVAACDECHGLGLDIPRFWMKEE